MIALVEVRAIVRRERLEHVVRRLKEAGVARLTVTRVHAIGAAVDAAAPNISLDEGSAYRDMALVQCICAADRCDMLVELITAAAHSGHRGDGIVSVHPVLQVHKIRTKAVGHEALR
jgi:nitrogen regulatory protein PII